MRPRPGSAASRNLGGPAAAPRAGGAPGRGEAPPRDLVTSGTDLGSVAIVRILRSFTHSWLRQVWGPSVGPWRPAQAPLPASPAPPQRPGTRRTAQGRVKGSGRHRDQMDPAPRRATRSQRQLSASLVLLFLTWATFSSLGPAVGCCGDVRCCQYLLTVNLACRVPRQTKTLVLIYQMQSLWPHNYVWCFA